MRTTLNQLDVGDFEGLETTQMIPSFATIMLNSGFILDLMTSIKGFDQLDFDDCFALSPTVYIEDIPVKFLHINQLIPILRTK